MKGLCSAVKLYHSDTFGWLSKVSGSILNNWFKPRAAPQALFRIRRLEVPNYLCNVSAPNWQTASINITSEIATTPHYCSYIFQYTVYRYICFVGIDSRSLGLTNYTKSKEYIIISFHNEFGSEGVTLFARLHLWRQPRSSRQFQNIGIIMRLRSL